jgi:hypothetical protein
MGEAKDESGRLPVGAAAVLKAGVMVVAPKPPGIPYTDTAEVRLIRTLEDSPSLASIEEHERSHLVLSLAQTFARALYHRCRFEEIVASLAERSRLSSGWMAYDSLGPVALFEAASVLGAVRVAIDELIFLIGRRHAQPAAIIDEKWKAAKLFSGEHLAEYPFNTEEVRVLRQWRDWQDRVNVYRNMLHHRGWREELAAYFPRDSTHPEASDPNISGMLIPDRESLRGTSRPHQWTYSERGRLEDLVSNATDGLGEVLVAVATECWKAIPPVPGAFDQLPSADRPSLTASLPIPLVAIVGTRPIALVFSTRAKAAAWLANAAPDDRHHVTAITPSMVLTKDPHFVLAVPGVASFGVREIHIELDRRSNLTAPARAGSATRTHACSVQNADRPGLEMLFLPAPFAGTQELFVLRRVL